MAQKVVVEMIDDLDGTVGEDVTTVSFALDGRSYEIDLNARNAQQLRDSLAEFVTASHRARSGRGGRTMRSSSKQDTVSRERAHAIREWAQEAGHEMSTRGRIPATVIAAYEEAQQKPTTPALSPQEATHTTLKLSEGPLETTSEKASEKAEGDSKQPSFSG
jgi:hypothetical protein